MAKKQHKPQPPSSPKNYIRTKGRSLPIGDCYIHKDWQSEGICNVLVTRKMPSGKLLIGSYLVDIFCLGVKDTHCFFGIEPSAFEEEVLDKVYRSKEYHKISAALAQNIIWGAVEYAEDLGFEPHSSFELTEHLLDPADKIKYIEVEFGKDGKPYYISGPYDDVDKIITKLTKKLGYDGFTFLATYGDEWDDYGDDEWDDEDDDEWDDEDDDGPDTAKFGDYIDFEETK